MLTAVKPGICIVNPYEHGGGAEYQIALLIDALAGAGAHQIHYLAHFIDVRERTRAYQISRIGDGGPVPRFGYLMEAWPLYRILRSLDPSIIYQRVACAYTGICALYAQRHGIPFVWHVAHDTEVTPDSLDPGRNIIRLRLEKWAAGFGARHAARVVVQTQHQADLLLKNYSRPADAIISNFHPQAAETIDKSGPFTVIWIANLKPWKQPDAFVRLAQALGNYPEVRFVMVGAPAAAAGNVRWQQALMESIQNTPNLEYVGQKSHAQVNELLARAHIFVNTSVHEGFPNTFIQAWLRDVAVVSLLVNPDQVLDRERVGLVADSESGLAAAVRQLIDKPQVRLELITRGREHARDRHSLRNAGELVRLLTAWGSASGRSLDAGTYHNGAS
jgi:glycosyltransferase involved in cell wall biosynthesis